MLAAVGNMQHQYLEVGGAEAAFKALVVQDLNLKGEVFFHVFDDHHEVGELDAQCALARGCGDVGAADVGA